MEGRERAVAASAAAALLRWGRRVAGGLLLVLLFPPWYRLLEGQGIGPAAEQTLALGGSYALALWAWSVLAVASALLLGRLLPADGVESLASRARDRILSVGPHAYAAGLALLATLAALWVGRGVLDGSPVLVDGVSQLVQARYFAAGMLSGPRLEHPEFWHIQFMVLAEGGWVSQYPPGFPALLSLGWHVGLAWLVGPLSLGLAVYLTSLSAERLFPDDPTVARIGAALVALSPFLIFHAAAYMNHALAAALLSVALYASLRSLAGPWPWSLLAGAAVGGAFATRPYAGLVLGLLATVVVWLLPPEGRALSGREWAERLGGAAAGAAPAALAVLLYNGRVFGDPLLFGYLAAEGPAHGLGFHTDPWGNPYGPLQALAYTSSDLAALSSELLQAPLPCLALVGLYLLLARRIARGAAFAAAWALLPVAANALYWHHDLFMGPRLLYETAPAWCLLLAASAAWLLRELAGKASGSASGGLLRPHGVRATLGLALGVAVLYAGPRKLASYGRAAESAVMSLRAPEVDRPSLVFVHGGWESRLGSRLSALGMRLDSVRAALRHNATCRVEMFLASAESVPREGREGARAVELAFGAGDGPSLRELRQPSGSLIRSYEGETLTPPCERQAASDFQGVVDLAPFLWRGDLPAIGSEGAMFVRDFGPERNARLLERFPQREPLVLLLRGGELKLLPYERGMAELWSGA